MSESYKDNNKSIVIQEWLESGKITKDEIEEYVLSEEGVGKAGAYGIHGPAGKYVTNIEGSYTNVVGLPVHETYEILKELNIL